MPLLVGIVGKPNVGKSTFFSSVTLATVDIASYPFTTIKPNRGVGHLKTKCVCEEMGVRDQPSNSICVEGVRFIPVEIVDTAGLIPDAWQGRGLGNHFLDEIRRADALIHIVDASGSTDLEGREVKSGSHNPLEDVFFLEKEITMWLAQIIRRDWSKITRTVESGKGKLHTLLEERLSGLSIKRRHIIRALRTKSLNPEEPIRWSEKDFIYFVDVLRRISKPMLIAANKIDTSTAEKNIKRLKETGYVVIPCSAEAELVLRRAAEKKIIRYNPGDPDFRILNSTKLSERHLHALNLIEHQVLKKQNSTGVQDTINAAFFNLLKMIVVYTVEDADKLTNHNGRVLPDARLVPQGTTVKELAYKIHTEIGLSFIHAIDARSKRRLGEKYILNDRDIISIISAIKRS